MVPIPALLVFLFPLAYSPGPGNLFFAANGARFGLRATLPANAGYHLATFVVTLGLGLGVGAGLEDRHRLLEALGVVGGCYVLWLALGLLRGAARQRREPAGTLAEERPPRLLDGATLLLLNPKAYVIIAVLFAEFLPAADGAADTMTIATVFTVNNLAAFTLWTVLGDRFLRGLRSPERARRLDIGLGVALAAVALWMLFG